ncbi:acetylxylan esterase [Bacteroides ovatus]|nr:acetylxylan esterase [Bacteroides ovatus]MDC2621171.1 acetylxylan esterase [Bacteroides ovatus]MDC2635065.1 acetylxylan esterase [Bacteroides ovatus]MDC2650047.1 acetylxylan esterase [Bacteroides ovatus]
MRQNSFRFVCLLLGLSFLGGGMYAQQKSARETGLRSKSTSELTELEQVIAKVNYDESKVPVYTLPDVLTLTNGRKVTTKKEWVEKRRPELLRLFETQIYGKAPARSKDLHFRLLDEDREALGGLATRKEVAVYLTKDEKHYLTVLMYLPNRRKGAVPMFFGINFKGNHAIHPDEGIIFPSEERMITYGRKRMFPRGSAASRWPVEMLMEHGYGLATFYRGDIDPDFDDGFQNGVHPLYYKKGQTRPAEDEWGTLAAWAWGMSCAMDYFETDKDIDVKRIAIFGHSRLGKTTLWAGAIDPRFALVISNDSGCGGAALSRRKFGETVRAVNCQFTHWFCRNFWQYNDKEDTLPVDQHELIALMAPRPVYIASAEEDRWADPKGEFLSGVYASPVYELFGLPGLPVKEMPAVNQPILSGTIGYHIRSGKHDINLYDWTQFVKFADKHLK